MKVFHLFLILTSIALICCNQEGINTASSNFPVNCEEGIALVLASIIEGDESINRDSVIARLDSLFTPEWFCESFENNKLLGDVYELLARKTLAPDQFSLKLHYYHRALAIRKKIVLADASVDSTTISEIQDKIIRVYYNIGINWFRNNEFSRALPYFDSAQATASQSFPRLFAVSQIKKGQCYIGLREFSYGLFCFDKAWEKDSYLLINDKVELYKAQTVAMRELRRYKQGLAISQKGIFELRDTISSIQLGDLYMSQGNLWVDSLSLNHDLRIFQEAENNLNLAKGLFESSNNQDSFDLQLRLARINGNLGELYRRMSLHTEADSILTEYISKEKEDPKAHHFLSQHYINRGENFYDQDLLEHAITDFNNGFIYLFNDYTYGDRIPNMQSFTTDRNNLVLLLSDLGESYLKRSLDKSENAIFLEEAIAAYDSLFKLLHIIRSELISEESKLEAVSNYSSPLNKAFHSCIKLYEATLDQYYLEHAFGISEQSKALVLLEATQVKELVEKLPKAYIKREKKLLEERSILENEALKFWRDSTMVIQINEALAKNFDELVQYKTEVREKLPNLSQNRFLGSELTIKKSQKELLDINQGMLSYYYGDSSLVAFLITPESLDFEKLSIDKLKFENLIKRYLRLIGKTNELRNREEDKQIIIIAQKLYNLLVAPFSHKLPSRLIINPSGVINLLPFESLIKGHEGQNTEISFENADFLVYDYSFSYCFSAASLWQNQNGKKVNSNKKELSILMSNFHPELAISQSPQSLPKELLDSKKYLTKFNKSQEREAKGIQNKIRKSSVIQNAQKQDFFDRAKSSQLIHVATHGILNEEDPWLSYISFSQKSDTLDTSELLFVKDLSRNNWNLDLVFFSACQTANGQYHEGEGNISLARSLQISGAKSVITSLWNVPTQPKARMAPDFYDNYINKGLPKDVSLSLAKRKIARSYPHPFYWAGFTLIGASSN